MDAFDFLKVSAPMIGVSLIFSLTQKGIKMKGSWVNYSLAVNLLICFIVYFIVDSAKGYSAWDIAQEYNPIMSYFGIGTLLVALTLFLIRTKITYLIGVGVYFLFLVIFFSSVDPKAPVPSPFTPAILLCPISFLVIFVYGVLNNPKLFNTPGIQLVVRVNKLTFEFLSLYVPAFIFGLMLTGVGAYLLAVNGNSSDTSLWITLLVIGLFVAITSFLSLIPKK